jgi:hypothetical protein
VTKFKIGDKVKIRKLSEIDYLGIDKIYIIRKIMILQKNIIFI